MNRRKLIAGLAGGLALARAGTGVAGEVSGRVEDYEGGRRRVAINGAWLNFSMAGEEHDTPLVVLHGGRGSGQHAGVFNAFRPMADRFRVIGYDMRGHGHSSVTPPFTFAQMVDDLEQIRLTLGRGRKMVLHGGSFGGFVALSYLMKYPQGLSHLMLRGTAPSWQHEVDALQNFQARAARKAPALTRAMVEKIFTPTLASDEEYRLISFAMAPMFVPDGVAPDYDAILQRCRTNIYRARVHNDLYEPGMWHGYDVVDRLPAVQVPTLITCGEFDWICDPAQSRLMAERIPGSRLVVALGADHDVPAVVLLGALRDFL